MTAEPITRLLAWLSPAFPTGGFAYSAGLEQAVADRLVRDRETLGDWLEALLEYGPPRNDAILFAEAWRSRDAATLAELSELAEAFAGSAERHRETMDQGRSFVQAARCWPECRQLADNLAFPVAVGAACRNSAIPCDTGARAFLQAYTSAQLQAAIRLSVVGQQGAAELMAVLETVVNRVAEYAISADIGEIGGFSLTADIACMRHETLQPRLFLS